MPDPLPFEYPSRASQFVGVPDQMQAALIDERDRALEDYLQRFRVGEWQDVTLLNGWTNVSYQVPQIRKVGDMVQTRGHATAGTLTAGTVLFVLPVGFRPPASLDLTCETSPHGTTTGHFFCQTSGNVGIYATGSTASVSWFNQFSVTP